ncbi:MAG: BrnA antitoxin family protein [Robiginitomaculum sp.]
MGRSKPISQTNIDRIKAGLAPILTEKTPRAKPASRAPSKAINAGPLVGKPLAPSANGREWTDPAALLRPIKKQMTIRFDQDIIDWFKEGGKGYQSRMNAVLRAFVEAQDD